MHITTFKTKILLFFIFGMVILYSSFYYNALNGADDTFFRDFHFDSVSEPLVLDNAFKDQEGITHKFSNLGYITMKGASERVDLIKQAYIFTDKTKKSISNIPVIKYGSKEDNDNVVFVDCTYLTKVMSAIGYQIVIGKESRFVKNVVLQDKLAKISYYGEVLPQTYNSKLSLNFESFGKQYIDIAEYTSQYGLQGQIVSFLFNKLNLSIKTIQKMNVIFFSFIILVLTCLFYKIFSKSLAVCFLISVTFSPWVVSFASDLYWIEFSWFLPAVFSWLLWFKRNKTERFVLYFCIYLTCWFKCLSGYEYFSSVLLFAVAPYFYACLTTKTKIDFIKNLKILLAIGVIGVLGFISALLMHAYLRSGGNIAEGLSTIWHKDVLRRTMGGDIKDFDFIKGKEEIRLYELSFNANAFDVVKEYISIWKTSVLNFPILDQFSFKSMLGLSVLAILVEYVTGNKQKARNNISLFVVFIIPALSWYILGKSHSFIHTHLNYVLWYMGGVSSLIYIIYTEFIKISKW